MRRRRHQVAVSTGSGADGGGTNGFATVDPLHAEREPKRGDPHAHRAEDVDADEDDRHAGEVLRVADGGLRDQHDEQDVGIVTHDRRRAVCERRATASTKHRRRARRSRRRRGRGPRWSRKTSRRRTFSSPPCGPAPVTIVPVTRTTRGERDHDPAHRPHLAARPPAARVPSGRDGPDVEHDGIGEQHHRHQEVRHDPWRRQAVDDGQAAEHDLRQHADHEAERQPRQVAGVGARGGTTPSTARITATDTRPVNGAVHELDRSVIAGLPVRGQVARVAVRPLRAAEA